MLSKSLWKVAKYFEYYAHHVPRAPVILANVILFFYIVADQHVINTPNLGHWQWLKGWGYQAGILYFTDCQFKDQEDIVKQIYLKGREGNENKKTLVYGQAFELHWFFAEHAPKAWLGGLWAYGEAPLSI